jgi:hypothetical protein
VKKILVLVVLLSGCKGSFEEAKSPQLKAGYTPSSDRCITLDDRAAFYGGTSKFAGALSGASGLATIAVPDDMKEARVGLAISSAAMAAVAVGAAFVSDQSSTSWARECSQ